MKHLNFLPTNKQKLVNFIGCIVMLIAKIACLNWAWIHLLWASDMLTCSFLKWIMKFKEPNLNHIMNTNHLNIYLQNATKVWCFRYMVDSKSDFDQINLYLLFNTSLASLTINLDFVKIRIHLFPANSFIILHAQSLWHVNQCPAGQCLGVTTSLTGGKKCNCQSI